MTEVPYNLISPLTSNAKLGQGVATNYRPVGDAAKGHGTCPSTCMHLPENGGGCYTKKFLVNNQQRNSWKRNDPLERFLEKKAKLIRLHTSGDFFKAGPNGHQLDQEYLDQIIEFSRAHSDVTIYTYTHDIRKLIAAGYTYAAGSFPDNLHIVASCDTMGEKVEALAAGFRVARVIDDMGEKEGDETLCPYDLALFNKEKPTTTCQKCTLCFNPKHKKNIAFLKQR